MIGLFIGSFNPPTLAHLKICLKLKKEFKKIVFVPVNSRIKNLVSFKRRCDMLNILRREYSFLDIDYVMEKYSYFDYRILDILKKKYHDIKIIIGSDVLSDLPKFNNYEYLVSKFQFVVITRDKIDINMIIDEHFKKYKKNFTVCNYLIDVSSTKARELINKNQSVEGILNKNVYAYIKENHIYF